MGFPNQFSASTLFSIEWVKGASERERERGGDESYII